MGWEADEGRRVVAASNELKEEYVGEQCFLFLERSFVAGVQGATANRKGPASEPSGAVGQNSFLKGMFVFVMGVYRGGRVGDYGLWRMTEWTT